MKQFKRCQQGIAQEETKEMEHRQSDGKAHKQFDGYEAECERKADARHSKTLMKRSRTILDTHWDTEKFSAVSSDQHEDVPAG